jgi:hypothetical protein
VSTTNVQSASSTPGVHLDFAYDRSAELSLADPGIDDPVNDTGTGAGRGDMEFSDEFACLIRLICERSGEFS